MSSHQKSVFNEMLKRLKELRIVLYPGYKSNPYGIKYIDIMDKLIAKAEQERGLL